jgi:hypothetical protein
MYDAAHCQDKKELCETALLAAESQKIHKIYFPQSRKARKELACQGVASAKTGLPWRSL